MRNLHLHSFSDSLDYSPASARFTTIDPIRDGANWFSYVVNDPVNYVDSLGLIVQDVKINIAVNQLVKKTLKKGGNVSLFSKCVTTKDFAKKVKANIQYLDEKTKKYVYSLTENELKNQLNKIKIVRGVDRNDVKAAAKKLGLINDSQYSFDPSEGDAFSIRGYIFNFDDSNLDLNKTQNNSLQKHEAIHFLQSEALGGGVTSNFLTEYLNEYKNNFDVVKNKDKAYNNISYEMAAYSFGPPNRDAASYYKIDNQNLPEDAYVD